MKKDKTLILPEGILKNYFGDDEIANFKKNRVRITGINAYTEKTGKMPVAVVNSQAAVAKLFSIV